MCGIILTERMASQGGYGMGIYLNPNNFDFQEALNSEIYIDTDVWYNNNFKGLEW